MTEVVENDVKLNEKLAGSAAGQNGVVFQCTKMSQQTILNGPPSGENGSYQSDTLKQDAQKSPSSFNDPSEVRPPLNRMDSRTNFIRSPFPNPQPPVVGGGVGMPQVRPPQPQIRPGPPVGAPFFQRGPPNTLGGLGGTPMRPLGQSPLSPGAPQPFPPPQNQGQSVLNQGQPGHTQNQIRPGFRPPFPRSPLPPNQQRPQIFQQRSVPAFGANQRPSFLVEDNLLRSQTLDSSELESAKNAEQGPPRSPMEPKPPGVNSYRGFSVSPNNQSFENVRKITGSTESLNNASTHGSTHGSMENLNKDIPSRPGSRMNRILENGRADGSFEQKEPQIPAQERSPEPTRIETRVDSTINHQIESTKEEIENKEREDAEKKDHLELKLTNNKTKKEGDNDSGVDESTQGNDRSSNGDARSPRKASKQKISSTTPSTARSLSRGSKTPSLQSPDSTATTPGSTSERKKIPMNKVQVGSAPSPNLKVVKSKIGSLQNANYKPGGGHVKIETKKVDIKATPRIEAKNDKYMPKGGEKKIVQQKLQWNAKSKIGSLENATYKPKGGEKKIESVKLEWKAQSKIGSKDNMQHKPGGGEVKIENKKLDIRAQSKVGSMDNVKHRPGGGEKKIFDDKDYLKQQKSERGSIEHSLSGSQDFIYTPKKVSISEEVYTHDETRLNNKSFLRNMVEEDTILRRSASVRYSARNEPRGTPRYQSSGKFNRTGSLRIKNSTVVEESHKPKWRM